MGGVLHERPEEVPDEQRVLGGLGLEPSLKAPSAELPSEASRSPVVQEMAGKDMQHTNLSLLDATYPCVGFPRWMTRPGPPNLEQK